MAWCSGLCLPWERALALRQPTAVWSLTGPIALCAIPCTWASWSCACPGRLLLLNLLAGSLVGCAGSHPGFPRPSGRAHHHAYPALCQPGALPADPGSLVMEIRLLPPDQLLHCCGLFGWPGYSTSPGRFVAQIRAWIFHRKAAGRVLSLSALRETNDRFGILLKIRWCSHRDFHCKLGGDLDIQGVASFGIGSCCGSERGIPTVEKGNEFVGGYSLDGSGPRLIPNQIVIYSMCYLRLFRICRREKYNRRCGKHYTGVAVGLLQRNAWRYCAGSILTWMNLYSL